jgi:hypothetical protein
MPDRAHQRPINRAANFVAMHNIATGCMLAGQSVMGRIHRNRCAYEISTPTIRYSRNSRRLALCGCKIEARRLHYP